MKLEHLIEVFFGKKIEGLDATVEVILKTLVKESLKLQESLKEPKPTYNLSNSIAFEIIKGK